MGRGALPAPVSQGSLTRSERREIDRWIDRAGRRQRIPGLALGLVRAGRVVYSEGWGYRDRERRKPASPRTVFGLASVTKSFTALAVLRLAEQGRLRVTDPVVRHLPEFRTPDPRWTRRITLHHFLTHSSGLPPLPSIYYTAIRNFDRDPPYDPRVARRVGIDPHHAPIDTVEQLLEFLRTEPYRMLGPPGSYFSYSNEGFGLLGAIVERTSGRRLESVIEEEVLRPAGMRSTTFDTGILRRSPEVTILYSPNRAHPERGLVPSEAWWETACDRGAGGLRSTVEDLLRYLEIFLRAGRVGTERVVAASSVARMVRPAIEVMPGTYYGYGVFVRPDFPGGPAIYHDGGLPGVASKFLALPKKGVGGVVLTNTEGANATLLLQGAINVAAGLPPRTLLSPLPASGPAPPSLAEYAGWYCSGEGIWFRAIPQKDRLRVDFHGIEVTDRGLKFLPIGHDRFSLRYKGSTGMIYFHRDARRRIWAVQLGARLVRRRSPAELPRARRGRMSW
jgi:CubicO group peptidase (beta-lactamase class C family)